MTTFMNLTNRVLRRLNEVEISQSDFLSATGIQATAKDAVQDALREINNRRTDWSFNAVEHTQTLVVGIEEYAWRSDFTKVDWGSFQLQKDDDLNINHKELKYVTREEWYANARDMDYDAGTTGRGIPDFVFPTHGHGFGLSPSPDQLYTLKYRYYKAPTDLEIYSDETEIPSRFDYVITAKALMWMGLFKEDNELVQVNSAIFERGLTTMTQQLTNSSNYMHSTQIVRSNSMVGSQGCWWL